MQTYPSLRDFKRYVKEGYTFIPITISKKVKDFNTVKLLEILKDKKKYYFILEGSKTEQYTYIGNEPICIIRGKNGITNKLYRDGVTEEFYGSPLDVLKKTMSQYFVPKIKGLPKFFGGAVGFLSYDMARYFECLPNLAEDDLDIPDLYFMIFDVLWVYENKSQNLYYIEFIRINDLDKLENIYNKTVDRMRLAWENLTDKSENQNKEQQFLSENKTSVEYIETSLSEQEYINAVEKIKEYISQGDVFQVNLSVRQSKLITTDGLDIYKHLRKINPSPYMGFINFPDMQIVSGSPELLIEVSSNKVQTRPIAGTRPRGNNEEEDTKLVSELLNNEKEIAEHTMLVDLERNDLGRVCKYGTVDVNQLMVVEKYSHVMHIVSNIIGVLDFNKDIYDCIKAVFPGGTITGAPKVRTMEIIEELEPVRRGPYTGSLGWIGFNGDSELNILIRTLLIKDKKGYIQAGAGIVIDSIPKNEYIESLNKAKALWKAVESSENNQRIKK